MEQLYNERLSCYLTAMRNEKPDKIPTCPFVAEFTVKCAGFICEDVAHDHEIAYAEPANMLPMLIGMPWGRTVDISRIIHHAPHSLWRRFPV